MMRGVLAILVCVLLLVAGSFALAPAGQTVSVPACATIGPAPDIGQLAAADCSKGVCSLTRSVKKEAQAIEFLSQWHYSKSKETLPEVCGVQIWGNDTEGWTVRGSDYNAGGDTLADASCGAIFAVKGD